MDGRDTHPQYMENLSHEVDRFSSASSAVSHPRLSLVPSLPPPATQRLIKTTTSRIVPRLWQKC